MNKRHFTQIRNWLRKRPVASDRPRGDSHRRRPSSLAQAATREPASCRCNDACRCAFIRNRARRPATLEVPKFAKPLASAESRFAGAKPIPVVGNRTRAFCFDRETAPEQALREELDAARSKRARKPDDLPLVKPVAGVATSADYCHRRASPAVTSPPAMLPPNAAAPTAPVVMMQPAQMPPAHGAIRSTRPIRQALASCNLQSCKSCRGAEGMEMIARQADEKTHQGMELADRRIIRKHGRFPSPRLRLVAQGLDNDEGGKRHSQALSASLTAMKRAQDFLPTAGKTEGRPPIFRRLSPGTRRRS